MRVLLIFLVSSLASVAMADSALPLPERALTVDPADVASAPSDFMRHPKQALDMADAMTEPEFLIAAMVMGANPELWAKAIEHAPRSGVIKQLGAETTPEALADWLYSAIDPKFQQAVLARSFDSNKPQRWMKAMGDPRFFMPALAMMNPALPMQWMKITADGRLVKPMQHWMNPATYFNWMRLPANTSNKTPFNGWQPLQRY